VILFPPAIPGPGRAQRPAGVKLGAMPPATTLPQGAGPPPGAPEEHRPPAGPVILELSTGVLMQRMALLVARFVPAGSTVLAIGREGGLLAQALAEAASVRLAVDFVALDEAWGLAEAPERVIPAEPVDAVVLDDDVMGLPAPERAGLIGHGLRALRPGGRLVLVVSDAGTGLWAEGLSPGEADATQAEHGRLSLPFGRAGLAILHRDGHDLGARACFEFVLEIPWPAWIAALPAPLRDRLGPDLWRLQRRLQLLRGFWPRLRWRLLELLAEEEDD
jgi:hypothetical protein